MSRWTIAIVFFLTYAPLARPFAPPPDAPSATIHPSPVSPSPTSAPPVPVPSAPVSDPHQVAPAVREQIKSFLQQKNFPAAEKAVDAALAITPKDPGLLTALAEVRIAQGRDVEAVKLLSQANQFGGETAYRDLLMGEAEMLINRADLANTSFRAALNLDPFNPVAHFFLARLLYNKKHYEEAIQESKNAIGLAPGFVRAYDNLGLCYDETNKLKEAEDAYKEAIRLDQNDGSPTEWPLVDFGALLLREGHLEESKGYLEQAMKINPKNEKTLQTMGLLKEKEGDTEGAITEYKAAIAVNPNAQFSYYRLGQVYRKLGQQQEAEKYLKKFSQLYDADRIPHPDAHPPTFLK